ncbi:hypothetical protein [Streptomyces sp. NPDC003077]|uniref:hypothetical protein n=1 Tax=Streptomyces sp. NPDC003077 TaxID=3154443 RepID=UPI0033A1E00F
MTARMPIPWFVPWSGERPIARPMIATSRGLAYQDEGPLDRDEDDVLLACLAPSAPGQAGKPDLGGVHPQRQRQCMTSLLCHCCGGPADRRRGQGVLWLLEDDRGAWETWPRGLWTVHPPVCVPCAGQAVRYCPHLRREGAVAVRVRESEIVGVHGTRYYPAAPRPLPAGKVTAAFGSPLVSWVIAGQYVRSLDVCELVDLDEELETGIVRPAGPP